LKYRVNEENSNRSVRFGTTVPSQWGNPLMAGAKRRELLYLKTRVISGMFSRENIDWWFLLRNHQKQ
jgi:hypothetical protein